MGFATLRRYAGRFTNFSAKQSAAMKEADLLIAVMADSSYDYAYAKSRDMNLNDDQREHALRVRRILEKRLGVSVQVDTATRYLEG